MFGLCFGSAGDGRSRGQWGLLALRAVTIAFAIGIVLGPTIIDEQPGDSTRPTLFYLLDGSQSMQLGGEATRWQESLNFISGAEKSVGAAVASHCKAYRFGHRLMPFSALEKGDATSSGLPIPERVASKLWRNIVYWVTEGSSVGRRRLVSTADKRFYRPGEKVSINAIAYDESARKSQSYRIWTLFEPTSLEDSSLYSPVLWPENVVRESGDNGMRIEMTAYEGNGASSSLDHGTQVDSTSLAIQVLSDPFEQQNPLPNRELLVRLASLSGGRVLEQPSDLADILKGRRESIGPPSQDSTPAWNRWWVWLTMLGLISAEWIWRRTSGLA